MMRSLLLALLPALLLAQSKTVEDNPRIKIISALDKPHTPTALHKHDFNRVMIYLDAADQDIQHPGEATEHLHWKAGDVAWSPAAGMHISEVMSTGNLRIVEIEIKQPPSSAAAKGKKTIDAIATDPSHNKLIFENPQVRVFRSTRDSGDREKWHEHTGAGRVVVLLSDVSARVENADGTFHALNGAPGDAFWTPGSIKHRGANIGTRAAEMIIVEVK